MYRPSTRVEPDKPLFPPAVTASRWQHTSDPVISLTISKFFFKSWMMLCGQKTGSLSDRHDAPRQQLSSTPAPAFTLSCFWYVCLMKDRVISCSCRSAGTTQTAWGLLCWEACGGETWNCGKEIHTKMDHKNSCGRLDCHQSQYFWNAWRREIRVWDIENQIKILLPVLFSCIILKAI